MTRAEVEETYSEDLGFRLSTKKSGVSLFAAPVDFELPAAKERPLQLLHVGHKKQIYAASNTQHVGIGKLADLDGGEQGISENFTAVALANVTYVRFDSTNEYLYVIADGIAQRAATADLLDGSANFEKLTSNTSVTALEPSPSQAGLYCYLDASQNLHIAENGAEKKVSGVNAFAWTYAGTEIAAVSGPTLRFIATNGADLDSYVVPEGGDVFSVSAIDNQNWLLVAKPGDGEEDEILTLVTKSADSYVSRALIVPPAFGEVSRARVTYTASILDWTRGSVLAFFTGALSTEITTLECGTSTNLVLQANDTDRAELPMDDESGEDTLPVGFALDFSGTGRTVTNPSPLIETAVGVLPRLLCLNNQGHLFSWDIFDVTGVRENTLDLKRAAARLPGTIENGGKRENREIVEASGNVPTPDTAPAITSPDFARSLGSGLPSDSAFGKSSFTQAQPGTSAFGATSFGTNSAKPMFGANDFKVGSQGAEKPSFGSSGFGAAQSGSKIGGSGFGGSSFGSAGSNFGASAGSGFGGSAVFGQASFDTQKPEKPFGSAPSSGQTQASYSGFGSSSKFGSLQSAQNTTSPFASLAKEDKGTSPFAGLVNKEKPSPFGDTKGSEASPVFGGNSDNKSSPFGALKTDNKSSPFGALKTDNKSSPFGSLKMDEKASPFAALKTDNMASPFAALKNDDKASPFGTLKTDLSTSLDKTEDKASQFGAMKTDAKSSTFGAFKNDAAPKASGVSGSSNSFFEGTSINQSSDQDSENQDSETDSEPSQNSEESSDEDFQEQSTFAEMNINKPAASPFAQFKPDQASSATQEKPTTGMNSLKETERDSNTKSAVPARQASPLELGSPPPALATRVPISKPGNSPAPEPAKEQVSYDGKDIAEIIEKVQFLKFGGFSEKSVASNDEISRKFIELVQLAQGNLDILALNTEKTQTLMDAASAHRKSLGTADLADPAAWALGDLDDLLKLTPGPRATLDDILVSVRHQDSKLATLMQHVDESEEKKEELQKIVTQLALYKQSLEADKLSRRPLDVRAEMLRHQLRKKLAHVESLHEEVSRKILPFGVRLDLGQGSVARVNKLQKVLYEVNAKARELAQYVREKEEDIYEHVHGTHREPEEGSLLIGYEPVADKFEMAAKFSAAPRKIRPSVLT